MANSTHSSLDELHKFGGTTIILLYVCGGLMSLFIVGGNVLVLLAYYRNKKLQTVTNFYLVSLSITDILLGSICFNLYLIYFVHGHWLFGEAACDLYLITDYVLYQVAIFHIILICIDRYKLLTNPIAYTTKRTKKRAKINVALLWLLAFLIWVPIIIGMQYVVGKRTTPSSLCYVQMVFDNWYISFPISFISYFIPVIFITSFYVRIYLLIKERVTGRITEVNICSKNASKADNLKSTTASQQCSTNRNIDVAVNKATDINETRIKKHFRAARIIIAICLAFTLNLLPYNTQVILAPICKSCYSKLSWHICYIICFINSGVNPICYAWGYPKFRNEFKKILRWNFNKDIFMSSFKKRQLAGANVIKDDADVEMDNQIKNDS